MRDDSDVGFPARTATNLQVVRPLWLSMTRGLPADVYLIDGSVGIGAIASGFGIEVELKIFMPGLAREQARALVAKAHQVCPYSNATRNNIDVTLTAL